MKYERTQPRRRAGFTLIELLVVIAIIAVLGSLLAGAVFRITASQSQKRTEATLKKLQTGLSGQWQAVVDSTKDELKNNGGDPKSVNFLIYNFAQGLAINDPSRARALYIKFRLKQEFPQTFTEALNPIPSLAKNAAKPTYTVALTGAVSPGAQLESAMCLYLALNQGRRGATFSAEDVGAGSVKSQMCGNVSLSFFVDAWGQPITFERWSTDATIIAELSAPPYTPSAGSADKEDPDAALYKAKGNWTAANAATAAAELSKPAGSPPHPISFAVGAQNLGFVIRSTGPNKNFGDGDDILGFRLMKEGSRGSN